MFILRVRFQFALPFIFWHSTYLIISISHLPFRTKLWDSTFLFIRIGSPPNDPFILQWATRESIDLLIRSGNWRLFPSLFCLSVCVTNFPPQRVSSFLPIDPPIPLTTFAVLRLGKTLFVDFNLI